MFQYMDVNPILATAMLSAAAGEKLEDYAEEKVFKPLGMKHYAWTRADEKGLVSGGWGLRLRAVDMARLGMLALQGGRWEGKQIAPAAWVKANDDWPEHAASSAITGGSIISSKAAMKAATSLSSTRWASRARTSSSCRNITPS